MDPPKTRKESKKDAKTKAQGKSIYSGKHVRLMEARLAASSSSASSGAKSGNAGHQK